MKIAVAIDEKRNSLDNKIVLHFGRAKNFLIYDDKIKKSKIFSNPETTGGKELPPDFLYKQKVNTIIVFSLGPMAYKKFNDYQIKMYKAVKGTIKKNLEKLQTHQLKLLTKKDLF